MGIDTLEENNISTIVTARGTAEGLILRLDGRSTQEDLKNAMKDFIDARKSFIEGNDVIIEWIGVMPDDSYVSGISKVLTSDYKISVKGNRVKNSAVKEKVKLDSTVKNSAEDDSTGLSLFDGLGLITDQDDASVVSSNNSKVITNSQNSNIWDEANTRVICTTLRSGQKIETEHSLLVLGDVNSGAEIIAGGDVVVLGTLRGIAHAGAYDESGGGRVIFALDLRPTQLRIGSIISRDGNDSIKKLPEIAHVDGDIIVVEPYNSRSWKRKG